MKKFLIVSLKYSPGLSKEIELLSKNFAQEGIVNCILSKHYSFQKNTIHLTNGKSKRDMFFDFISIPFNFFKSQKDIINDNIAIFYNPHPANFILQLLLKTKNTKSFIVLHEPYKNKEERRHFGFSMSIYFQIVNCFQRISLYLSEGVITMSSYGTKLFKHTIGKHYNKKVITSNLLFDTELPVSNYPKKYVSLIGQMNKNKGVIEFFNLVNYCLQKNILDIKFKIITSSNITDFIGNLSKDYPKILTIVNNEQITDNEITTVIKDSIAVCILHRSGTQSGVLPQASKHGIPVIIRDIPAFTQYYDNNGEKLPESFTNEDFLDAIRTIEKNFNSYSVANKNVFSKYFSNNNFKKFYQSILQK